FPARPVAQAASREKIPRNARGGVDGAALAARLPPGPDPRSLARGPLRPAPRYPQAAVGLGGCRRDPEPGVAEALGPLRREGRVRLDPRLAREGGDKQSAVAGGE